jgi:hypothetical protein
VQVQEQAWKIEVRDVDEYRGSRRARSNGDLSLARYRAFRSPAAESNSGAPARVCSPDRFAIESIWRLDPYRLSIRADSRGSLISARGSLREHFALEASGRASGRLLVLALRIFPSEVLAGIKAEGLPSAIPGMARRWQTLCKASGRRLSAPFVPLSAGNE